MAPEPLRSTGMETGNESRALVYKDAAYCASDERKALADVPTSHIAKHGSPRYRGRCRVGVA